jgi:hypothetical protein
MDTVETMYAVYVALSVGLTVWVARTLSKAGIVFLEDVFDGNERLANAVNHLLVVGFYLINLGYITLALRVNDRVDTSRTAIEALSWKIGLVLVVLGGMHFMNLYFLNRYRRRVHEPAAPREPRERPYGRADRDVVPDPLPL